MFHVARHLLLHQIGKVVCLHLGHRLGFAGQIVTVFCGILCQKVVHLRLRHGKPGVFRRQIDGVVQVLFIDPLSQRLGGAVFLHGDLGELHLGDRLGELPFGQHVVPDGTAQQEQRQQHSQNKKQDRAEHSSCPGWFLFGLNGFSG